jgi:uncharacterized metal-binding protein
MVDLPKKKVGIVACSGEELAVGTVTRLAALKVLERLCPDDTVTICLPLFLAGGEGDRAFARFYPTIAVDGCELRCAARATEMYSGKPAAGLVVSELVAELGLQEPQGHRRLDQAGNAAVEAAAERMADMVDQLLDKPWSRRTGQFISLDEVAGTPIVESQEAVEATCACGSGIPVQKVIIDGESVTLVALPLIFQNFRDQGKLPQDETARELLDTVKLYNPIPSGAEETYAETLLREYAAFSAEKEAVK